MIVQHLNTVTINRESKFHHATKHAIAVGMSRAIKAHWIITLPSNVVPDHLLVKTFRFEFQVVGASCVGERACYLRIDPLKNVIMGARTALLS